MEMRVLEVISLPGYQVRGSSSVSVSISLCFCLYLLLLLTLTEVHSQLGERKAVISETISPLHLIFSLIVTSLAGLCSAKCCR